MSLFLNTSRVLKLLVTVVCAGIFINAPHAQQAAQTAQLNGATEDRVALYQALLDLTNPWTVMCIAAHPDDEDGTSLIVMRHKYGAHTVSLFSTFGEGGQNAIGPELYEELGAIRARETMAAAEIQGSEPHFLGLKDFGYSKAADEAFRVWGHDEALRRMVLQIRKLRPDVIITNHSVTNNDHGHHQATARLELEAFDAAADPKRFPEQLTGEVTVWQVQRLFVRAGRSNQAQDKEEPRVTIDPNESDPIRGMTYAEEALQALQKHATQGPWPRTIAEMARFRNAPGGKLPEISYRLVREAKGAETLPKDAHNFSEGLRVPEEVAQQVAALTIEGQPALSLDNRSVMFDRLVALRQNYDKALRSATLPRFFFMRERAERALALAAGVTLTAAPSILATPNSTADVPLKISNSGTRTVELLRCATCRAGSFCLDDGFVTPSQSKTAVISKRINVVTLKPGAVLDRAESLSRLPDKMPPNIPLASHLYEPNAFGIEMITRCSFELAIGRINVQASTKLNVASAVEIAKVEPFPLILTPGTLANPPEFSVLLVNNRTQKSLVGLDVDSSRYPGLGPFSGVFEIAPHERHIAKARVSYSTSEAYEKGLRQNTLLPKSDVLNIGLKTYVHDFKSQGLLVARKEVPVIFADAHVAPNLRVGYIPGFDYSLQNALAALGVKSKELSAAEVKAADLQQYSTIIVDNRVYESKPELIATNQELLDYVKAGGTLIVFYHKSNEWNPDERRNRPQLAPYKLILGDERITDETAPVTFIEPQHPLLNLPNKIGPEDFTNWIQERGLYYPKEWDANYHALLQSNDPGEAPLKGGLLVADYGRGHYIYTSMVWYRELRAGVPGAYRVLANMISYGHTTR